MEFNFCLRFIDIILAKIRRRPSESSSCTDSSPERSVKRNKLNENEENPRNSGDTILSGDITVLPDDITELLGDATEITDDGIFFVTQGGELTTNVATIASSDAVDNNALPEIQNVDETVVGNNDILFNKNSSSPVVVASTSTNTSTISRGKVIYSAKYSLKFHCIVNVSLNLFMYCNPLSIFCAAKTNESDDGERNFLRHLIEEATEELKRHITSELKDYVIDEIKKEIRRSQRSVQYDLKNSSKKLINNLAVNHGIENLNAAKSIINWDDFGVTIPIATIEEFDNFDSLLKENEEKLNSIVSIYERYPKMFLLDYLL